MNPAIVQSSLKSEQEIELTVTGRTSGKPLPRPVWFVIRGRELLLISVTGTDCQGYKNIIRNPKVTIRSGNQAHNGELNTITEQKKVREVFELFEKKYGLRDMKRYYPNPNVAASLLID